MSQTAYILLGISYYVVSVIIIVIVLNLINNKSVKIPRIFPFYLTFLIFNV